MTDKQIDSNISDPGYAAMDDEPLGDTAERKRLQAAKHQHDIEVAAHLLKHIAEARARVPLPSDVAFEFAAWLRDQPPGDFIERAREYCRERGYEAPRNGQKL